MSSNWFCLRRSSVLSLLSVFGLLTLAGCSSESDVVPVFPFRSELWVDGKPAKGAIVIFHRTEPTDLETTNPNGRVQSDGSFRLTTYETHDGAPAGDYRVTVFWPEPPQSPVEHPDMGPDRLKNRYTDPDKSQILITVAEGENVLKPLRLDSK